jgi:hypothetical protein
MNPSLLNLDRRLRVVESALFGWTSPIDYGVSGPIPSLSEPWAIYPKYIPPAEAESTFDWRQISHPFDYPDLFPDALAWRVIPSVQDNLECSEHSRG